MSVMAFAWDVFVPVPLIGTVLAFIAWRQVAGSQGTYSGGVVAKATLVILPVTFLSALGFYAYSFATEIPPGYRRVSFATDISKKGFITDQGRTSVHPDVEALTQEPVFLKGYMYQTKQTENLSGFVLCKDSGDCCFGGQPKVTDMIFIEMQAGQKVDFRSGLVAVAGNLKVSPTVDQTGLNAVYKLECDFFSGAKTSY
ncbi:MAG: hypothetical protein SFV23_18960 [Planctomycetaceae bacterium]|nr:hypothetical protein [Planctomycetaceae bacterium]